MSARVVGGADGVREAAARLRSGLLVGLPTETVYGLAADARSASAVAAVFDLKGRPSTNPLIVHVADVEAARGLARVWPESAQRLADRFWPGPLTLVVEHRGNLAPAVVAGGTTVGLRVPAHPLARAVLEESGVPVAAPSANRSESVSPTSAAHVVDSLGPWADELLVLDGGDCAVGIESTVVDVTGEVPLVLRPGMITLEQLRAIEPSTCMTGPVPVEGVLRSPGQQERHYAPRAVVVLVESLALKSISPSGKDAVLSLTVDHPPGNGDTSGARWIAMPQDAPGYASALYRTLRALDDVGVERILVEEPPVGDAWGAVHDRLRRASVPVRKGME